MTADSPDRSELLRRFFAGVTEHAFAIRMGVADPPLVDYVSELLVRFVHNDAIYGLRTPRGDRLMQVADMPKRKPDRARLGDECTDTSATSRSSGWACIPKSLSGCGREGRTA
jgi:hypothetical protein